VYAEYETYLKNKGNKAVSYAHVDSVNIFELIEDILGQPRNNPIQQFEKYSEIEIWLREQWAGLFRELLQRLQSQAQISSLQAQVAQLSELNTTLKRYLEEIVSRIAPKESEKLIMTETKRLADATLQALIRSNAMVDYLHVRYTIPLSDIQAAAKQAISLEDFVNRLMGSASTPDKAAQIHRDLIQKSREHAERDLNILREVLGKQSFDLTGKTNSQRLKVQLAPQKERLTKLDRRTKKPRSN
jgi:phage gp36-like protein